MRGIIFGLTHERAYRRMDKLIQDYKDYWHIEPEKVSRTSNEYSVVFVNGDYWQACKLHDGCRGKRANVVYIDNEIDTDLEFNVAHHCATALPYSAIQYF